MRHTYRLLALLLVAGLFLSGCTPIKKQLTKDPGNVAILVIDDFGHGRNHHNFGKGGKYDNCAIGANDVGSGGAADGELPDGVSHGAAVYQVLQDEVSRQFPASGEARDISLYGISPGLNQIEPTLHSWSYNGHEVVLLGVHVAQYKFADVKANLSAIIGLLSEPRRANSKPNSQSTGSEYSSQVFHRFVLNLSFVVVPCDIAAWLDRGGEALRTEYQRLIDSDDKYRGNKYQYLRNFASDSGRPSPDLTTEVLERKDLAPLRHVAVSTFYKMLVGTNDQLMTVGAAPGGVRTTSRAKVFDQVYSDSAWKEFTNSYQGDSKLRVISVGAAGNGIIGPNGTRVRPKFPFAPAIWDSVVSATAPGLGIQIRPPWGDSVTLHLLPYANYGEVELDGTSTYSGVHGTSFAAPRLSAFEAIYLLNGGPIKCSGEKGASTPPLKYTSLSARSPEWYNKPPGAAQCHLLK
jgi:hypothetical protein